MIQLWQLGAQRADYRIVIELSMTWETQKCDTKQRTRRKCTTMVTPTNSLRPVLNTPRTLHTSRTLLHPCCTTFRVSIVRRVGLSHNSCYIFNILSLGFFVPFFRNYAKMKTNTQCQRPPSALLVALTQRQLVSLQLGSNVDTCAPGWVTGQKCELICKEVGWEGAAQLTR